MKIHIRKIFVKSLKSINYRSCQRAFILIAVLMIGCQSETTSNSTSSSNSSRYEERFLFIGEQEHSLVTQSPIIEYCEVYYQNVLSLAEFIALWANSRFVGNEDMAQDSVAQILNLAQSLQIEVEPQMLIEMSKDFEQNPELSDQVLSFFDVQIEHRNQVARDLFFITSLRYRMLTDTSGIEFGFTNNSEGIGRGSKGNLLIRLEILQQWGKEYPLPANHSDQIEIIYDLVSINDIDTLEKLVEVEGEIDDWYEDVIEYLLDQPTTTTCENI